MHLEKSFTTESQRHRENLKAAKAHCDLRLMMMGGAMIKMKMGILLLVLATVTAVMAAAQGPLQVVNKGIPAIHVGGPFSFSRLTDTRFYHLKSQSQIWQGDITSDTTFMDTELVDLLAACPGVPSGFTAIGNGILTASGNDQRLSTIIAPGNQGSAYLVFVWDKALGCSVANYQSGQVYGFCASNCASAPPIGTFSTTGNTCWGTNGTSNGIHDSVMDLSGTYVWVSVTGTWTQGACAGYQTGGPSVWQIGTTGNQWCKNVNPGTFSCGAHQGLGYTHLLTPSSDGPNIRLLANVASFTPFYAPLPVHDAHFSWAHPAGDDTYPWVGASDLALTTDGSGCASGVSAVYCPRYPVNMILGLFPNAVNQTAVNFGHTFSCGQAAGSFATCPLGGDSGFGAQESIGYVSQTGKYFCFVSSMLGNLGNDNTGKPRSDAFCIGLQ